MMATNATTTYDHKVEIRIPTKCGDCKKALPEALRDSLLIDAKRDFSKWFGGFEVVRKHGGYTFPDGTLAEEEVDVVEASCSSEALEEHLEDLAIFAVRVANELSQDSAALSIDGKMRFYDRTPDIGKCLHAKKGKAVAMPLSVPEGRKPKSDLEKMQALYNALDTFPSLDTAKFIFSELLSYDITDETLPWRDWPKDLRDRLKDAPKVIAYERGFKIVYLHQSAGQLSRGTTRAVISRILRDNANSFYGLFIVSNDAGDEWALVNARIADGKASRLILRSIPVGTGKGARTATDRLILVDLDGREKLTAQQIQELHDGAFDVEGVSNEFYKKIAAWYFWAQQHKGVEYPRSVTSEADKSIFFIRLLTRLIFCWFMRQKGLIPRELFDLNFIKIQLKDAGHKSGTYHRAILQNLFFATLNREIKERSFRRKYETSRDGNYGVTTLYRYADLMNNPDEMLDIFKKVPFVNGGLFECLDDTSKRPEVRLDDFSENTKNNICIPNELLFGQEREIDLSKAYGGDNKHKKDHTAGLIHILSQYQFTVQENTPLDQSVALDPELLGKVFENLLASYNEETKTTARKALGAFYTPREIVEYMVDESLLAYLKVKLADSSDAMDEKLRKLIGYDDEPHGFSDEEVDILISALDSLKALDPAVGSGAFPMGMLHKLVHILGKLDPGNEKWKQKQLAKIDDVELREQAERAFRDNPADYGRKLYLIQNCIYGVDIQPVAVQIAKMRFFISLIVDQKSTTDEANNYGILALPNLETNFVAANTLIGIDKPQQQLLRNPDIDKKEKELHRVRQDHFNAKTPKTKAKCREKDEKLRAEIAALLKHEGWGDKTAQKLANWNPYDQNAYSDFFDPEWMFGIIDGVDIVIGNPPYIDSETMVNIGLEDLRNYLVSKLKYTRGNWDIYIAFFEVGFNLLSNSGVITYITPDKWISKPFGYELRKNLLQHFIIITESGRNVFESVNVDSIITFIAKSKVSEIIVNKFINKTAVNLINVLNSSVKEPYTFDWLFSNHIRLIHKIETHESKLSEIGCCDNACATSDAYKLKEYIINIPYEKYVSDVYLKIINTGTIDKYINKWGRSEMTYLGDKYLCPVVKKSIFKKSFTNTYGNKAFESKLIIKGLTLLDVCLDENGEIIPGKTTLIVTSTNSKNLKFLLGILNSKLPLFYIKEKYRGSSYNQGINFNKDMINNLPMPKINDDIKTKIVSAVDSILNAKKRKAAVDTSTLEKQIDDIVFKIYGLTKEEIQIIEGDI